MQEADSEQQEAEKSNSVTWELHTSTMGKRTWKATALHPAWDGVGARVQLGVWHNVASIHCKEALLTSIICFFLSLSHEKVSWGRKKAIGRLLPSLAKVKIQAVTLFLQTGSDLQNSY